MVVFNYAYLVGVISKKKTHAGYIQSFAKYI